MRIAIDLDGVLVEWNRSFLQLLSILTGRSYEPGPEWPEVWDWPEAAGYTKDEIQKAWLFVQENPDWWFYLNPTDDAITCLNEGTFQRLFTDHDVFVITNRVMARPQSEAWLYDKLGFPVGVIDIEGPKGPLLDALQVELAIDDKPEHLTSTTTVPRLVLISATYNRLCDDPRIEHSSLVNILEELVPPPLSRLITSMGDGQEWE